MCVKEETSALETGLVFGLLAGMRGVGSVVSGPLSTALVNLGLAGGAGGRQIGYETQYGWLIVFTGVTALLGGWGWGWRMVK